MPSVNANIQNVLKKNNIPFRKMSPRFKYKTDFFSTYTKESCYWAGLIAADGYIRYNRDEVLLSLKYDDIDLIQKFSNQIKFTGEIKNTLDMIKGIIKIVLLLLLVFLENGLKMIYEIISK
jgi:hypothetical protein